MRPELQAKLLQHLNKKKADKGFTLVELLVVIVIIGILTAIALPSFLNQTAKAKQSEAKQNVSSVIKAQQSLRTEQSSFTVSFDELALGTLRGTGPSSTTNYAYSLGNTGGAEGLKSNVQILADSQDLALKSYSGMTVVENNATSQVAWTSVICEAIVPASTSLGVPTASSAVGEPPACPTTGKAIQ
jgi:type IV pilus assembly protein PilA